MNKSQGISCRISKVNEQLQRLANLLQDDQNLYSKTKEALKEFRQSESSEDSFNYFQLENQLANSKGFNGKIEVVSNFQDDSESNAHGSTAKSGLMGVGDLKKSDIMQQQQQTEPMLTNNESRTADVTVKKFRPMYNQSKKKKESQQKTKENSKLKNSKSENKIFLNSKTESMKKSTKKQEKQIKKVAQPYHLNSQLKGIYKKMKTTQNIKTNSQNRLNQSLKMHINLKREVNMKIIDLNIQKQQCQKEAEYLKAVMKLQQQQKLQSIIQYIGMSNEESVIQVFMARLIVNFFSQFFHQKIIFSEECTCQELEVVLKKKNYLIKYMLKLPDILKKDNTLCEERCKKLFEEKHFINHRIQSTHKSLHSDPLYIFVDCLHDYISFLINNNVVKQTKRKALPYQFHSQRSGRGNTNSNTYTGTMNINIPNKDLIQAIIKQREKQYNSDRKSDKKSDRKARKQVNKTINNYETYTYSSTNNKNVSNSSSKPALKRVHTHKVLSPKGKISKGSHSNNHSNIHNYNVNREK